MKGTWAEVSSVRFGAVSGIEGRSCCSSGVMSGTRPDPLPLDADGAVDYDICVHPSDARNDFNGCTGDEGAETTCCALPTGRVTCEDGFTAIMEAYDDTSATTQAATGCKDASTQQTSPLFFGLACFLTDVWVTGNCRRCDQGAVAVSTQAQLHSLSGASSHRLSVTCCGCTAAAPAR